MSYLLKIFRYLIREKSNSNDVAAEKSSLRGRDIEGENVKIPEGYKIVVLSNKGKGNFIKIFSSFSSLASTSKYREFLQLKASFS